MARTQRLTRTFTFLPFLFLFFATGTSAETAPITVTVWDNSTPDNSVNASPPIPPAQDPVGTFVTDVVWQNFDAQPVMGLVDDFQIRYEGYITTTSDVVVSFYAPADDGVRMFLNNELIIDDWVDKGGGGSISQPVQFLANQPVPFTLWFYENGGGAWVQLWWLINNQWEPTPISAFTGETTTTSTSAPTTTVPETTTTEAPPETTTTSLPEPTTTLPPETVPTTTTDAPPSTTTTSSSVPPETTTTTVQTTVPVTTVPVTTTTVPVPTTVAVVPEPIVTTTTQTPTTTTQPVQEQPSLPQTEEYQSAMIVNGGVIGVGLKPATLISNGLRDDVTPAQQRMVVAASVLIAMPSPVARRKA